MNFVLFQKIVIAQKLLPPLIAVASPLTKIAMAFGLMALLSTKSWGLEISTQKDRLVSNVQSHLMVPIIAPPNHEPLLNDLIFDRQLRLEFRQKYFEEIGALELTNHHTIFNHYDHNSIQLGNHISSQKDYENRRLFGTYMFRRLTEYHGNIFIQSNRHTRPVHQFAEKISTASIKVSTKYSLKANYDYTYNSVNLRMKNPLDIENTLSLVMAQDSIGPTEIKDTVFTIITPLSKSLSLASSYTFSDRIASLVTTKAYDDRLSTKLTLSTYTSEYGVTPREHLMQINLVWYN